MYVCRYSCDLSVILLTPFGSNCGCKVRPAIVESALIKIVEFVCGVERHCHLKLISSTNYTIMLNFVRVKLAST